MHIPPQNPVRRGWSWVSVRECRREGGPEEDVARCGVEARSIGTCGPSNPRMCGFAQAPILRPHRVRRKMTM